MLNWVLDRQGATLIVALITLLLTIVLYIFIPKGFFPVQDTGAIQGITEAPETISFAAMAERQQALAHVILQDPSVESLSSFIGVDGTNTTLNSGRMLINLKPLAQRSARAADVIHNLQTRLADVQGITLYMQPVQDLTIEDRVSRTQYQFTVEDVDPDELALWVPKIVDRLRQLPELADVATDLQNGGLQVYVDIDRADREPVRHHARDGGQRALQRVRAAVGVDDLHPDQSVPRRAGGEAGGSRPGPDALAQIYVPAANSGTPTASATGPAASASGGNASAALASPGAGVTTASGTAVSQTGDAAGPADRDRQDQRARRAAGRQPRRPVSRRDHIVQSRAGRFSRRGGDGNRKRSSRNSGFRQARRSSSRARRRRSKVRSPTSCG